MSEPKVEPGEVVTPVEALPEGEAHHVPVGEEHRLITGEHSIADVLRYLIGEAGVEEVRCVLGSMVGYEAAGPWQEGEPEESCQCIVRWQNERGSEWNGLAVWDNARKLWMPSPTPADRHEPAPDEWNVLRYARINSPDA